MVIFDFWLLFGTNMFTRFQNLALFSELVLANQKIFDDSDDLPKGNSEEDQSFFSAESCSLTNYDYMK